MQTDNEVRPGCIMLLLLIVIIVFSYGCNKCECDKNKAEIELLQKQVILLDSMINRMSTQMLRMSNIDANLSDGQIKLAIQDNKTLELIQSHFKYQHGF